MNPNYSSRIAGELKIRPDQVNSVAALLDEGCAIPFIARYRKEATGSLDEVAIMAVRDRLEQLALLDTRRAAIVKSLAERELLTDELSGRLTGANTLAVLEDIYLPFRPKRRTRASAAKERGLEPLARAVFEQSSLNPERAAQNFVDADKGVNTTAEALAGAGDIMAEWISENADVRAALRRLFHNRGELQSKLVPGKEEAGAKFRDYFDAQEKILSAPGHRILAVFRGEKEGILSVSLRPPEAEASAIVEKLTLKARNDSARLVLFAGEDAYKRLIAPSLETEIRNDVKKRADEEAITVFASNLRDLLYTPPLGGKRVMALDPGFRTGAKLVCLDSQGKLLHYDTIFPLHSEKERKEAAAKTLKLCKAYDIEAIAVGSGTAGRETESFVKSLGLPKSVLVVMVNESGASIYSASKIAREEFPDHDITVRGAVSIGRRLMDPLAELVKIDPKSIGVGQYQHDVDQSALKRSLDEVVSSCVNSVGVELNTASKELLTYVAGLGPAIAKNIVQWRDENGRFGSRKDLKKVQRLGLKAFQQCAGFLRVRDSKTPLDTTAVHPESYHIVEKMAKDVDASVKLLMQDADLRSKVRLDRYITSEIGLPTLNDIINELAKPGLDPRAEFEAFSFNEDVNLLEDLQPGMKLPGIVTNITKFGAFVDIGVHQDGLVHISELADRYVSDPAEIVKVQQQVQVTVLEVDIPRKRISLSLRR